MDEDEGNKFEASSLHKFLYTFSNPVNLTDPTGYAPLINLLVTLNVGHQVRRDEATTKGTIGAKTANQVRQLNNTSFRINRAISHGENKFGGNGQSCGGYCVNFAKQDATKLGLNPNKIVGTVKLPGDMRYQPAGVVRVRGRLKPDDFGSGKDHYVVKWNDKQGNSYVTDRNLRGNLTSYSRGNNRFDYNRVATQDTWPVEEYESFLVVLFEIL